MLLSGVSNKNLRCFLISSSCISLTISTSVTSLAFQTTQLSEKVVYISILATTVTFYGYFTTQWSVTTFVVLALVRIIIIFVKTFFT